MVQETQVFATQRIEHYLANPTVPFRVWLRHAVLQRLADLNRRHLTAGKRSVRPRGRIASAFSAVMLARQLLHSPSDDLRKAGIRPPCAGGRGATP